jgi:hypothetical protein
MSQPFIEKQFDLEETIDALGLGEVIGRRNFEAYREWAKLERDWLGTDELEHLKRGMVLAKKHNRSLRHGLERTRTLEDETAPKPSNEPASLTEMIRELRDLRTVSETSREKQDALIARLKTEDSYYATWETRLRRSEEEILALWNLIDEVINLSSASIPRLEKLERRVGYELRQANVQSVKTPRVPKLKST